MEDEIEDTHLSEVDAIDRFLTDQQAVKVLMNLVSMYAMAQHEDDDAMEDAEIPELSRNNKVLLLKGIYELFEDILGPALQSDTEDEGYDEEYASVKIAVRTRLREVAKDKRMSTYYKAFMGQMRNLVNPWHADKNKFLNLWAQMGDKLYSESPADEPDDTYKLAVVENDQAETASAVGGHAPLNTKVARALAGMGFKPVDEPEEGDAAWCKTGADDGFPEKAVYLIRRDDNSYLVQLAAVDRYSTYGRSIKRRILEDNAPPQQILTAIGAMYDLVVQE